MGRKTWTEEQEAFIIKNANTMTSKQMGLELGRTEASVQIRLNQMGIKKERPKESFTTAEVAAETKFNRLTVQRTWIEEAETQKRTMGEFLCECGNKIIAPLTRVKNGNPKSCGCLRDEKARERTITRNTKHHLSKHPLFGVWSGMKTRCYNENTRSYQDYGARGITICDAWLAFKTFYDWALSHGYKKGLTIDRRDNDLGYNPDNCRWVTDEVQGNNKRSNKRINAFGETKTISEWSKDSRCQVSYQVLRDRLMMLDWEAEKAIATPARPIRRKFNCTQDLSISRTEL